MIFYYRLIRLFSINKILAVLLFIMIINTSINTGTIGYYNKIIDFKLTKILSNKVISLIITTVSGDKRYEDKNLVKIFRELQILHLLVLSGSNIVILVQFISGLLKKNTFTSFIVYILAIYLYFCYVGYLHPVARAFIFMTLYEFIYCFGLKESRIILGILFIFIIITGYFLFNESKSFLLSGIFAYTIFLYNIFFSSLSLKHPYVSKFIIFPFFMTFASIPVHLFFFDSLNITRILISNIFISPIYEFIAFFMYLIYLLSLFQYDFSFLILQLSYFVSFFLNYLVFINNLLPIYNI